ncbi:MAG: hypothetical protein R3F59_08720 [Myxococcota bacterium]
MSHPLLALLALSACHRSSVRPSPTPPARDDTGRSPALGDDDDDTVSTTWTPADVVTFDDVTVGLPEAPCCSSGAALLATPGYPVADLAAPTPGAPVVDPTFGVTIRSGPIGMRHTYSQLQPFSSDGRYLMLDDRFGRGDGGTWVYDASDVDDIVPVLQVPGELSFVRWIRPAVGADRRLGLAVVVEAGVAVVDEPHRVVGRLGALQVQLVAEGVHVERAAGRHDAALASRSEAGDVVEPPPRDHPRDVVHVGADLVRGDRRPVVVGGVGELLREQERRAVGEHALVGVRVVRVHLRHEGAGLDVVGAHAAAVARAVSAGDQREAAGAVGRDPVDRRVPRAGVADVEGPPHAVLGDVVEHDALPGRVDVDPHPVATELLPGLGPGAHLVGEGVQDAGGAGVDVQLVDRDGQPGDADEAVGAGVLFASSWGGPCDRTRSYLLRLDEPFASAGR